VAFRRREDREASRNNLDHGKCLPIQPVIAESMVGSRGQRLMAIRRVRGMQDWLLLALATAPHGIRFSTPALQQLLQKEPLALHHSCGKGRRVFGWFE